MKKLHENIKIDDAEFNKIIIDEAKKHSERQRIKATKKKVKTSFLKNVAKKIVHEHFENSKSVLCLGCRDVSELILFESNDLKARGIDVAIETDKIIKAPAEKMLNHFTENQFDFIYASHSLEHVLIPEIVMKNIRLVSKKGCYVILPLIKRNTPKKGHPVLFDICNKQKNESKETLIESVKKDFKQFEPYEILEVFFAEGSESEFHICFKWK